MLNLYRKNENRKARVRTSNQLNQLDTRGSLNKAFRCRCMMHQMLTPAQGLIEYLRVEIGGIHGALVAAIFTELMAYSVEV